MPRPRPGPPKGAATDDIARSGDTIRLGGPRSCPPRRGHPPVRAKSRAGRIKIRWPGLRSPPRRGGASAVG